MAVLVLPSGAYCSSVVAATAVGGGEDGGEGEQQQQQQQQQGRGSLSAPERLRGGPAADVLILRAAGWGVAAVRADEWRRLEERAGGGKARRRDGGGRQARSEDALAALQAEYLGSRLAAGLAEAAVAAAEEAGGGKQ